MYPITDLISGRPAGQAPVIRTIGRRKERNGAKPKYVLVVPEGEEGDVPKSAALWIRNHEYVDSLLDVELVPDSCRIVGDERCAAGWSVAYPEGYEPFLQGMVRREKLRRVSVWRGVSKECGESRFRVPLEPRPISSAEILWLKKLCMPAFDPDWTPTEGMARMLRGDILSMPFILEAPWRMDINEAEKAAIEYVGTEHLYCGVREENGRWVYYRGLGSHLIVEGAADTREEAEMMARATLMRAWLERVEEIRRMRGGVLDWGWPLPSPFWQEVGDPQKEYGKEAEAA